MNEVQILTRDQINGLLTILEREYIIPKITDKINLIKETDKYKNNYNKIKETSIKVNELVKELKKIDKDSYTNTSINESDLCHRTLNSLYIRPDYDIKSRIKSDLRTHLQLISLSDFESIIKGVIKYIDVDKHLYREELIEEYNY